MSEKRETVEEIAQRETRDAEELERRRLELRANQERLAKEAPARFCAFAALVREQVRRFNAASEPGRRLSYSESAALSLKDLRLGAELTLSFGRKQVEVGVALREMVRFGLRPEAYLTEAWGSLKEGRFGVRIEAHVREGQVVDRITVDYKPVDYSAEELAERLVLAAVRDDLKLIVP